MTRPLDLPVILGTTRQGRASAHAAQFVHRRLARRVGVRTSLIDLADLPLPWNDAGETVKDAGFSAAMSSADGLVIVAPEYNHSFPGVLKHALDTCLHEYVHKAVGIVGVSAGPFGGTRVVQSLLPVMRELGLVTIFWDVNVGSVGRVFDATGRLLDSAFDHRCDTFLDELVWMAKTLRYGRERITTGDDAIEAACAECGDAMTHYADKLPLADTGEPPALVSLLACPGCGGQLATTTGTAVIGLDS